ncbi:hypothetical protein COV82_00795 [Candidatus Peregrinibacteria bacterium CG11_big_fil_rev_8_21_14_0_20_46_8]|nr:MAG: hypothetical protein COV82_00795 [Candidatus Peregrinibacteria bacterium CG11_big_fil_rev_8_21_14_0_20_46_8]
MKVSKFIAAGSIASLLFVLSALPVSAQSESEETAPQAQHRECKQEAHDAFRAAYRAAFEKRAEATAKARAEYHAALDVELEDGEDGLIARLRLRLEARQAFHAAVREANNEFIETLKEARAEYKDVKEECRDEFKAEREEARLEVDGEVDTDVVDDNNEESTDDDEDESEDELEAEEGRRIESEIDVKIERKGRGGEVKIEQQSRIEDKKKAGLKSGLRLRSNLEL